MIVGAKVLREIGKDIFSPFQEHYQARGLSGGLGPAGYDVALELDEHGAVDCYRLKPGEFILGSTIEHIKMPEHLLGIVHDKSTLARRGLAVQNTVIEPGWEGYLTLELTNHSNDAEGIMLWRCQPIAQIVFQAIQGAEPYTGKYQYQARGPVKAKD